MGWSLSGSVMGLCERRPELMIVRIVGDLQVNCVWSTFSLAHLLLSSSISSVLMLADFYFLKFHIRIWDSSVK